MSKKLAGPALPLHAFVRRQQVLRMFRALLRGAADLDDSSLVGHVREQIRFEFRNNAKIGDNVALRNLIQDGQRQLAKLQSMGTKARGSSSTGSQQPLPVAGSTWLSQRDTDDERGRIGKNWPWQK